MVAVAVLAVRGQLVAGPDALPVRTRPISRDRPAGILVTLAAIDRRKTGLVRVFRGAVEFRVATHAVQRRVNAGREPLLIHGKGEVPPAPLHLQSRPTVAFQAIGVLLRRQASRRKSNHEEEQGGEGELSCGHVNTRLGDRRRYGQPRRQGRYLSGTSTPENGL